MAWIRDSDSAFASPNAVVVAMSLGSTHHLAPSSDWACSTCSPPATPSKPCKETLRYTHGDRFPKLPGYHTFSTHWHMATAMAALQEKMTGNRRSIPDFVGMFKSMGVEIVHLAEFHGDGHPQDAGPLRLVEMESMFEECRRLSNRQILFLPGEEANNNLGLARPGTEIGHWTYLFPRPVYWTMNRACWIPVRGESRRVMDRSTTSAAVPRCSVCSSASRGSPGRRIRESKLRTGLPTSSAHQDFYLSDRWLGAAWKAMPADLSHDQLGRRALDLLDDMANWGQKKYMPGEVDVFKIDHTHELYGHMNVNYVRLEPGQDSAFRRKLAAGRRCPPRRAVLRHDGRGLDPQIHAQWSAERVNRGSESEAAG